MTDKARSMADNKRSVADIPASIHNGPPAYYRCESTFFGPNKTEDVHFRDDEGGFLRPADLYYAELTEEETETTYRGFFCATCIERFGKKYGHRPTLAAFLEAKATGQAAGLGKKLYETLVN